MSTNAPNKSVNVAIVEMTDSCKTVFISSLAMQMAQDGCQLSPAGDDQRQTLHSIQSDGDAFKEGRQPDSVPDELLIDPPWELTTQNHKAYVQFLDCSGQDIRPLFGNINPENINDGLKNVYEIIRKANILVFNFNTKDLQETSDNLDELIDAAINCSNSSPRKIAVVFHQFDNFKPEVDQNFNGDFLEFIRHYKPYIHWLYIQNQNFEIFPSVNGSENVIENGENQSPAQDFSSSNFRKLAHWLTDSVDELEPVINTFSSTTPQTADNAASSSNCTACAVPHPEQLLRPSPKYSPDSFTFLWIVITLLQLLYSLMSFLLNSILNDQLLNQIPLLTLTPYVNITAYILISFLLYRCWNIIQDGYAWIPPAFAFLLFASYLLLYVICPYLECIHYRLSVFFHLVSWVGEAAVLFVLFYGLSKNYNNYINRHSLNVKPCFANLTLVCCIILQCFILFSLVHYLCYYFHFIWYFFSSLYLYCYRSIIFEELALYPCKKIILLFALYLVARKARDIQRIKLQQTLDSSESNLNNKLP